MKYENAGDVLPVELLKEIQKFAAGKLLYVPAGDEKRAWGESSGYRIQLQRRNLMMCNKYTHGVTISELADEYYLSLDTVKKIIYSKKNEGHYKYAPTINSAVQYTHAGMLDEWIHCYLLLTRKAESALYAYMNEDYLYFGVVKFPLRLIQLDGMKLEEIPADRTDGDLTELAPLLVRYVEGKFHCIIQNDLFAELKQRKLNAFPTIIVMNRNDEYKRFKKYYGTIFHYVDNV